MWIDSHNHLTAEDFDADREAVLARARAGGVPVSIVIGSGYGVEANRRAAELAAREPGLWATVGVHPHEARLLDDAGRERLREWLALPRVVAVGECGLDYHYMNSPRETQREVFAEQVALARERDLPVSIHVRDDGPDAYEDLLAIWRAEGGGAVEGVLHCYTGGLDFARRALDQGLLVSFSGILTFKRAGELRDVARGLPLDRLLVETDAPFLAPEGQRGKRNEPAWVARVGEVLAALHGVALEEAARVTARNTRRLFRLPEADSEPARGADPGVPK
jgi:TatD DNase family protein